MEPKENRCSLFELVKSSIKKAKEDGSSDEAIAQITEIQVEFTLYGDIQGVIFCEKGLSVIKLLKANCSNATNQKVNLLEEALEHINSAIILASKNNCLQPSFVKQQSIVKSTLAGLLHQNGNHMDANFLENDALKALNKVVHAYPDYSEGYLEMATASFSKLKWSLHKILADLNKADHLFNHPIHKKHLPDPVTELPELKSRIENLRQNINQILTVAF